MSLIPRNILSGVARPVEDEDTSTNCPNHRSELIDDEWLLVDSNGESTPASQLEPEPSASNPAATASVDMTRRTSTGSTSLTTNTDSFSNDDQADHDTTSLPIPKAIGCTRTRADSTCNLNPYLANRGKRRVLYDFIAAENNELSVVAGEDVFLLNFDGEPEGWLVAENSVGQVGWIPRAYVQDIGGDIADSWTCKLTRPVGPILDDDDDW